jgi:hypothetical protein
MPIWVLRLRWNNLGGCGINQTRVKDLCFGCGRTSEVQPAHLRGSENLTFSSDISYIASFNICKFRLEYCWAIIKLGVTPLN